MTRPKTVQRSMTGYAAATAEQDGFALTVSLRSVNHRYLDLRTHLPERLLPLEREARSVLQATNPRGHVELKVTLEFAGGGDLEVDEALAARYVEIFRRLGTAHGLASKMDTATLAQLPGVVTRKESRAGTAISPAMEAAFRTALQQAVERWDAMRAEEAAVLVEDMATRVAAVGEATERLEQGVRQAMAEAKQKLAERLQTLASQPGLDPARLAQEALLLADRTDPTEEMLRLRAHVERFGGLLGGEAAAGRKLDFLLQEIMREANTLLSKVAGLGAPSLPVTELGLQIKAEVEKLREQVQNLE